MKRIILIILSLVPLTATAQTEREWNLFTEAVALVESNGNQFADDGNGCLGLFQITEIYVREVNRIYGTHYTHKDALDKRKAFKMFNLMQSAKNPEHDFKKALDIHNPRHPQSYADKVYKRYNELLNENVQEKFMKWEVGFTWDKNIEKI